MPVTSSNDMLTSEYLRFEETVAGLVPPGIPERELADIIEPVLDSTSIWS